MRRDLISALTLLGVLLAALVGCRGGAEVGESCAANDDCHSSLQCLNHVCMPRCTRAPECGDGYSCDAAGLCVASHLPAGDNCSGEPECAAGLACQINGAEVNSENRLVATCTDENVDGGPAGAACAGDGDCRNLTCELGHCVDLCRDTTDCAPGTSCKTIPRAAVNGELFEGCLPTQGTVSWKIPVISPSAQILLPVPTDGMSAELVMSVDDPKQKVGVESVLDPCGCTRYTVPCPFQPQSDPATCTPLVAADEYYSRDPAGGGGITGGVAPAGGGGGICGSPVVCNDGGGPMLNRFRHIPTFGHSVLLMPSIPAQGELTPGAYRVQVSSFWPDDSHGSAVPHVTAVVRIGRGTELDLHFFFLDLEEHPCSAMTANAPLTASSALNTAFFQTDYLGELSRVFNRVGLAVKYVSYQDISDRHALDGVDVADIGSLFALGAYTTGINVFFVRSLSPLGTEVFGPTPGPAGVAATRASGIAISLDTLCYRDWPAVARLTAHALGHYMGLYHNVEPRDPVQAASDPPWQDLVPDTDASSSNLMYFSQAHAGSDLSVEQTDALGRSPVLR